MIDMIPKKSPVQHLLERRQPSWRAVGGVRLAMRFPEEELEPRTADPLALCDLSGFEKLGLKGSGAEAWLRGQSVEPPTGLNEIGRLADGGYLARLGNAEFLLESGFANSTVAALAKSLGPRPPGVYEVHHSEATFLVAGANATKLLAQTCGLDLRNPTLGHLILTRVAGVSCGLFAEQLQPVIRFRLWVDPSFAVYLWETLVEIVESLSGRVVGAGSLFPDLTG